MDDNTFILIIACCSFCSIVIFCSTVKYCDNKIRDINSKARFKNILFNIKKNNRIKSIIDEEVKDEYNEELRETENINYYV